MSDDVYEFKFVVRGLPLEREHVALIERHIRAAGMSSLAQLDFRSDVELRTLGPGTGPLEGIEAVISPDSAN